jgi:sugar lactone lactonase YvrE
MRRAAAVRALAWALVAAASGALSACAPTPLPSREEATASVASPTIADARADEVYGQLDLYRGDPPAAVDITTVTSPHGLATDPFFAARGSDVLWVADTGSNRLRAFHQPDFALADLRGQPSYVEGAANAGNPDPVQNGFDQPLAVAWASDSFEWMAADTGNHRVVRGYMNSPPRLVYGQHGSFVSRTRNEAGVSSSSLADPKGVALAEGVAYVADAGNHRVLGFPSGSTFASYVFGQSTSTAGDPNGGGVSPGPATLSDPHGLALATSSAPTRWRGLWIADTGNHRVVHAPYPANLADFVLGQDSLYASTLVLPPTSKSLNAPTAVALDPQGGVWVADTGNHRVLHFPRGVATADRVLGQRSFTEGDAPLSPDPLRMLAPTGVAVGGNGDLFVADTGHHRLLRFRFTCAAAAECDDADPCTDDACTTKGCTHTFQTYSKECAPYACVFATRLCGTSCAPGTGGQCASGFACIQNRCVRPCATDVDCKAATGHPSCRHGYCCDGDCSGLCESCSEPGFEGTCHTVFGAPRRGTCPGVDADCAGRCEGKADACSPSAPGSACGVEGCLDGVVRDRGRCDGAGTCRATTHACGAYGCLPAGCRTSCERDADCAAGAYCDGGACLHGPLVAKGAGCSMVTPGDDAGAPLPCAPSAPSAPLAWLALVLGAPLCARAVRRIGGRR